MSKVVVINHVTLDGVMQAPGRSEEDTRDGFTYGGWATPNTDAVMMKAVGARMGEGNRLLLGRRSYEGMLGYWNTQDSPFKEGLNNAPKYVASRTLAEPLPWRNSTLLRRREPAGVAQPHRERDHKDRCGDRPIRDGNPYTLTRWYGAGQRFRVR